jgi:alkyldihydroxyacetonephosphate synthase
MKALAKEIPASTLDTDPVSRLRHGHGHTMMEIHAIHEGQLQRVPDLVVHPTEESHVVALVTAADTHDVVLIPYGGGTCVTEALLCPTNEGRMIVSVDMRQMNRIEWIDPVNRLACIQAGAVGRHIMDSLAEHGFTIGHEPDSVEFSTLGGWVATNASGMKKNRYGNIEDIVMDVRAVTARGTLERFGVSPRESTGADPRRWLFGSEGNLGIITSAVVKLFPLPEAQRYGSVLFPSFDHGVRFMYDLAQAGQWPASVRLVDNLQFQFSMALKPAASGFHVWKSKLEKLFVTKVKGFQPDEMVACTLVYEGTEDEVSGQEKTVARLGRLHDGMPAGSENGRRGYQLTFSIAYIRDFVYKLRVMGESFETSVAWSDLTTLCANVKRRVIEEHVRRGLPGVPFITCRVTQIYDTGACVYFYLGLGSEGVENPIQAFMEIETAARDEILKSGGSLSHHHGVGKLRQRFLPQIMSETAMTWNREAKDAIDPNNVFGCGNLPPSPDAAEGAKVGEAA